MKTVAKVAIGCGVALLLAGIAAVAVFVGGAYWVKRKVEQVSGHEQRIQELKKKAGQAAPFTRPADGVIQEPRLLKFLEIRKRMSSIYEQHRPEIEKLNRKEKGDLRDAWNAFGWINELRRGDLRSVQTRRLRKGRVQHGLDRLAQAARTQVGVADVRARQPALHALDQDLVLGKVAALRVDDRRAGADRVGDDAVPGLRDHDVDGAHQVLVREARRLERVAIEAVDVVRQL